MSMRLGLLLSTALVAVAASAAPALADHGYGGEGGEGGWTGGGYHRFDRDIGRDRADLRRDWAQLARLRYLANQYARYAEQARYYGDWRAAREYEELRRQTLRRIAFLQADIYRDRRDQRRDRWDGGYGGEGSGRY
jgi:hypothetical protein